MCLYEREQQREERQESSDRQISERTGEERGGVERGGQEGDGRWDRMRQNVKTGEQENKCEVRGGRVQHGQN